MPDLPTGRAGKWREAKPRATRAILCRLDGVKRPARQGRAASLPWTAPRRAAHHLAGIGAGPLASRGQRWRDGGEEQHALIEREHADRPPEESPAGAAADGRAHEGAEERGGQGQAAHRDRGFVAAPSNLSCCIPNRIAELCSRPAAAAALTACMYSIRIPRDLPPTPGGAEAITLM
jgi:hypothetical protein